MPPIRFLGKFSPLKVPGCALWLEADRGITLIDGKVSAWADQSGNGRDFSQATATYRPLYTTTGIGGFPSLNYDGAARTIYRQNSSIFRNITQATLIVVVSHTVAVNNDKVVFITTNVATARRLDLTRSGTSNDLVVGGRRLDADAAFLSDAGTDGLTTGAKVISAIADWGDSAAYAWVNGTSKISDTSWGTNGSTSDTDSNVICIGATNITGASSINGLFSVLVAWPRALSTSERRYLQYGFGRKYGVAIAA